MAVSGRWLRSFVALLLAVVPPLLLLVVALLLAEGPLAGAEPDLVALGVVVGSIVWAAVLAIVFARVIDDDTRSLLAVARRGDDGAGDTDDARRALASALDERNRQVSELARGSRSVPIDADPRSAAAAITSFVRAVMRDPTWSLAVLRSDQGDLLPPGVYAGSEDADSQPDPIGDLERWASTASADSAARRVEGPWGAFAVADVTVEDGVEAGVAAILYAPWEGRAAPSPAELDLLSLVGQHAAASLEHSILYARVRTQADELNRLAAVQADFLRGVTHDLQTPLTSIGALAAELRAGGDMTDAARIDLDSISHQAERLRRMVGQLLVASRLEAGAVQPLQEVFAVRPLVERTWNAQRAERPFDVKVLGSPHLAVGDPDRVEQVLWAVLDNAIKYSPADAPIEVAIRPDGSRLLVSVSDRGMGMDSDTASRAFDQFYRAPEARRMAPDGSGIGLYAARGLMRAMGGDLTIDSQLGGGTTLTLHLPAEPADAVGAWA